MPNNRVLLKRDIDIPNNTVLLKYGSIIQVSWVWPCRRVVLWPGRRLVQTRPSQGDWPPALHLGHRGPEYLKLMGFGRKP